MTQRLILLPQPNTAALDSIYSRAFEHSTELYILSAYLTSWAPPAKLGASCKTFEFIVGKDYGITRKQACESVLKWLPKDKRGGFKVAVGIGGFHPKAMFWKEKSGRMYALVGSSNLTDAAFRSNHEANSFRSLTEAQFEQVRRWTTQIGHDCERVDAGWLRFYAEADLRGRGGGRKKSHPDSYNQRVRLPRPANMTEVLRHRHRLMKGFKKNRSKLLGLFERCSTGRISSADFYKELPGYWNRDTERFQGAGFERTGRDANFRHVSQAILAVWNANDAERDQVVEEQRDWLAAKGNPARASFFSEMLCQLFPHQYPVVNRPVRRFMSAIKYRSPRGASEGEKYVALAKHLRFVLRMNADHPAKNLAELDAVVWAQYGNTPG
jgi:hypothetical protein